MNVLVDRCSRQTQLVSDMVDTWKDDHDEAMQVVDLEELILGLAEHSKLVSRAYERMVDMLFDDKIHDIDGVGNALRSAVRQTMATFAKVSEIVASSRKNGYTIAGGDDFASAYEVVRSVSNKLDTEWPFFNRERAEKARREFLEGKSLSSEELLDAALREGFLRH